MSEQYPWDNLPEPSRFILIVRNKYITHQSFTKHVFESADFTRETAHITSPVSMLELKLNNSIQNSDLIVSSRLSMA